MAGAAEHPEREALRSFLLATLPEAEDRSVHRHLETGCARCLEELRRQAPAAREVSRAALAGRSVLLGDGPPELLEQVLARTERLGLLVELERRAAPERLAELLRLPPLERREAVRSGRRYQTLGLAERLTEASRRQVFHDVVVARELAALAVEVVESMDRRPYPPGVVVDATALAWAASGNAERVASDLFAADRHLRTAVELLATGSGDPLVRADVLGLLGSLRIDQTRYREAIRGLEEVARLYRGQGDVAGEAGALLKMGRAAADAGEPLAAARLFEQVLGILPADDHHRLRLFGALNLARALADAEQPVSAREVLMAFEGDLEQHLGDFSSCQRVLWVRAQIASGLDESSAAEALYETVRAGYLEREMAYDYALATLDLAVLYLAQGRTREVRELTQQIVPLFASGRIHKHALAALAMFLRAAEAETASVELARQLTRYLARARGNPYLPFAGSPEEAAPTVSVEDLLESVSR